MERLGQLVHLGSPKPSPTAGAQKRYRAAVVGLGFIGSVSHRTTPAQPPSTTPTAYCPAWLLLPAPP